MEKAAKVRSASKGLDQGRSGSSLPTYAEKVAPETARIAALKAKWTPPEAMAAAPVAPAAGPKVMVPEYDMAVGGVRRRVSAHWRAADVFDQMERDARIAHERRGDDAPFEPPFTPGQVDMARYYLTLTERHAAGGVRCASLEAGRAGGGGDFMQAFLDEGRLLQDLHRRIGDGVAMAVRRVRPSRRGAAGAGVIKTRWLVDAVCIGAWDDEQQRVCQWTLNQVLEAAGWAVKGEHRLLLRRALASALDRMQGYRDTTTPK